MRASTSVTAVVESEQAPQKPGGHRCPTRGWQSLVGSCDPEVAECRLREIRTHAVLGRLTRGFAHQLANDLATVQAAIDLISTATSLDPARAVNLAQNAIDDASWLLHQIQAITDRGAHSAGRLDLGPIVQDVARLVGQTAKARLETRVQIAEGIPAVMADAGEIREALTVLFSDCIEDFLGNHADLRSATLLASLRGVHPGEEKDGVALVQLELAVYPGRAWERDRIDSAQPLSTRRVELAAASGWTPADPPLELP